MSEERERRRRERGQLQHEAEHARPRKKGAVLIYLSILFAAAFLLLLLSYFMQQRSAEQTINGLQNSVNSFQGLENLLDVNKRLTEENKALAEQVDKLTDQTGSLEQQVIDRQDDVRTASKALDAMDWFWRIQRAYSRGNRSEAKSLAEQFEANGLTAHLPTASDYFPDAPSPAQQYDALLSAMGMQRATP